MSHLYTHIYFRYDNSVYNNINILMGVGLTKLGHRVFTVTRRAPSQLSSRLVIFFFNCQHPVTVNCQAREEPLCRVGQLVSSVRGLICQSVNFRGVNLSQFFGGTVFQLVGFSEGRHGQE